MPSYKLCHHCQTLPSSSWQTICYASNQPAVSAWHLDLAHAFCYVGCVHIVQWSLKLIYEEAARCSLEHFLQGYHLHARIFVWCEMAEVVWWSLPLSCNSKAAGSCHPKCADSDLKLQHGSAKKQLTFWFLFRTVICLYVMMIMQGKYSMPWT